VVVLVPRSLDDACAELAARPGATLLAGGTDLMVGINAGRTRPADVVATWRLPELRGWSAEGDEVVLGAALTYTECLDPALAALVPVLAQAARTVGSPQIRNAGTLGGNLATASPAGDAVTALVALGGVVTLRSTSGERDVDLTTFALGPRRTQRRPDELIVSVRVPVTHGPQEFLKVGPRNAMVIAVASLAMVTAAAGDARVALGSVGPTAIRAAEAEAYVAAARPGDAVEFATLVAGASTPIDDHRATAAYRRHAVEVLARRAHQRVFP
jgi:CO/xanthine dehydrogenase FAD-binding subunit